MELNARVKARIADLEKSNYEPGMRRSDPIPKKLDVIEKTLIRWEERGKMRRTEKQAEKRAQNVARQQELEE